MPVAEWILTFDDGPLAADVVDAAGLSDEQLLGPLTRILEVLETHPDGPIKGVFFLRGPAHPWPAPPPDSAFKTGVDRIMEHGHYVGLHAYRHDPDLWWNWLIRASEVKEDLDCCRAYFEPMVGRGITVFRPPYGQGGPPAFEWAREHSVKYQLMDVDPEDWKHHPDAFNRQWQNDPQAHLNHMLQMLLLRMWFHTLWPGPNDVLFHVNERTAEFLPRLIDRIGEVTRQLGHEPEYVVPAEYVRIS